jgi:phosphoglycolate phosphatase-like HAD superfamily hydrolase
MSAFDIFLKSKDRIVCIDSDGCAVDTMNIKHIRCFGPCMVDEWDLGKWRNEILNRWNEINLFSMTRGINRFKGLALILAEGDEKYCAIEGIDALKDWVDNAAELSNASLDKMIDKGSIFSKALKWSKSVNSLIEKLPKEEIKPFHGVREAFKVIHEYCDIAVVSSANPEAVRAEWERLGLLEYVDLMCTQDMGSKSFCIGEILKKGYEPEHVLMCGDAPGDENAAAENGVLFFPILVNHENESWSELKDKAFSLFVSDSYSGAYQNELLRRFESNLGGIQQ